VPVNPVRNFVAGLVQETKKLCRFITRHRAVFSAVLSTVVTDPADLTLINTMLDAVVAGCAALEKYYPNISA